MAEYKLYCLDQNGRISQRIEMTAIDDGAAVATARDAYPDSDCELWSGTRKVARLPARRDSAAPVI